MPGVVITLSKLHAYHRNKVSWLHIPGLNLEVESELPRLHALADLTRGWRLSAGHFERCLSARDLEPINRLEIQAV